jgi:prepilin-type N-terminal cleavage/methylation domain-containing protein
MEDNEMKKGSKKSKKGFTLIELVVVIAILGILAAILIPVIGGFISRASAARDLANARNLYNCVAMVLATNGNPGTGADRTNISAEVLALFGTMPAGDTASFTRNGNIVVSATYLTSGSAGGAQTYTR